MTLFTTRRQTLGQLLAVPLLCTSAGAQSPWPDKALRLIVPAPAGGGVDVFVRTLAEQLATALKQSVIVDNKPGAGGLLGTLAAAQAAPDGYNLAYLHSGLVTVQAMNPRLNLLQDFRPVAKLTHSPFLVVVNAESRYRSLQDLISAVQAAPSKLSFGTGGAGRHTRCGAGATGRGVAGAHGLHRHQGPGVQAGLGHRLREWPGVCRADRARDRDRDRDRQGAGQAPGWL